MNGCVFRCNDADSFRAAFARLPNRSAESLLKCNLRQSAETLVKENTGGGPRRFSYNF